MPGKKKTQRVRTEYHHKWRKKNIELSRRYNREWKKRNKDKVRKQLYDWRKRNPERFAAICARWRQNHLDEVVKKYKRWYKKNVSRVREYINIRARIRRADALLKYGGTCKCCGENMFEFLSFDHKNGRAKHTKMKLGFSGKHIAWLLRNPIQKDLRVLCHNCNMAYGLYGFCPHQLLEGKRVSSKILRFGRGKGRGK